LIDGKTKEKNGTNFESIGGAVNGEFDDTRSMKSEFDYSTKKKFVEMIS
jgi:hypothetical protein